MQKSFEAVYENGVLRPLENPGLPDLHHVMVTISELPPVEADLAEYFSPQDWALAKHDDISLAEVRRALASIRGSLADTVIASREER